MGKGRNLARTSLFIRAEQLEQLRAISAQTGVTIAFMVRAGIDSYLAGHRLRSVKDDAGQVTTGRS
jgi:predicted DNA-binding protein